jgi:hypothetical protein
MKTRHGLIAMLRPAIVLHPGIGLVCDPDFENVLTSAWERTWLAGASAG